ncbi:uncharacterized protein LOC115726879 isoform X2 [Rhodamnia argentea]|uniref:Uncharacterized protein LOC115726879 isoform X2 n=1 Tax=Rhodamnia argentea TaxID=178133 RepID=A0A8B8MRF0_9MYRT|nr:uncharacterized protein LOC115726879 isoform X2 [Rhodamnia argentea]
MAASLLLLLLLLPAIFPLLLHLSHASTELPQSTTCPAQQVRDGLVCELRDLRLKVARLESILEERTQHLDAKGLHLKQHEKLVEELSHKIISLQSTLYNANDDLSNADKRLRALEEEVRRLWAASRKNNFDLHVLESKAKEAEARLEVTASKVEKLADIVSEQWIQVQHLEQALQITEVRTLNAQRRVYPTRCTFLKFIDSITSNHLQMVRGMLHHYSFVKVPTSTSHLSRALHLSKKAFLAGKKYHHELQGFIKREMERNEIMAPLANDEVVFFVASAIVMFPIMSIWVWFSSLLQ